MATLLNLTVPDAVLSATGALRQDTFYLMRPQDNTVSGITTPGAPLRIGPLAGEFWAVRGDELAPDIAEARGHFRLAVALDLTRPDTNTVIVWADDDQVEIAGIVYDVTWLPPPSGLDLTRIIGLKQ